MVYSERKSTVSRILFLDLDRSWVIHVTLIIRKRDSMPRINVEDARIIEILDILYNTVYYDHQDYFVAKYFSGHTAVWTLTCAVLRELLLGIQVL